MSEADAVDPLVGRVIADAYVVQDLIGIGGMGRVYRAEQRALGRVVAIKVVHRHLLGDRESVQRFYTEARAASSLNHPNSVSVFDFGRTDDGMLYLVMEYLRGRDLAQVMSSEPPLPMNRIVELVLGVLGALGEAHARGVVHRDLKPENIIIERLHGGTDLVKVVDFGLAQIRGGEPSETAKGLVAGTPDYMAPEQARGLDVDGRGDLYALGVVLFELLTGRLPYVDESPAKVMLRHVIDPIPSPQEIAPYRGIPDALSEVTRRALQKEPSLRYQDADQMAGALRQVAIALRASKDRVRCPRCGALTEGQRAFCGDCGMRLSTPSTANGELGYSLPPPGEAPLLGRATELSELTRLLAATEGGTRIAYLLGEMGIGKSRLLAEVIAHAEREGFLVIDCGPHESGTLVAYAAIRRAVARLLNVTDERLVALADDESLWRDRVAHAGIHELVHPEGVPGHEGRARAGAVAAALARAVSLGSSRASSGRVLLAFDDLARCDGLTADVIAAFRPYAATLPVFVVVATRTKLPLCTHWTGTSIELAGLGEEHLDEFIGVRGAQAAVAPGGAVARHHAHRRAHPRITTPDEP
ncbi:MAG: protein kinase, partial [Polyangiales bacterium]